ncbi:phospholipase A2 group XV-like [Octopus sinensis]|uniref:Phospholipase A2 group XV-like n=1 Tax=Octopus sinensis TaxID=2607531 RepID=A0A6P7U5F9_9MOLL|nr:phospholipase A2 group XV-like [Octopus sinensis]
MGQISSVTILLLFILSKEIAELSPVFLIPGDGGSKLYAKFNKSSHYNLCFQKSGHYFLLWAPLRIFMPVIKQCYFYISSYGCIITARFLTMQTREWREKYIRRFISISGPYNGSTESIRGILIGITC